MCVCSALASHRRRACFTPPPWTGTLCQLGDDRDGDDGDDDTHEYERRPELPGPLQPAPLLPPVTRGAQSRVVGRRRLTFETNVLKAPYFQVSTS